MTINPDRYHQASPLQPGDESAMANDPSLQRLVETADYVIQRALQLDEQVQEAEQIVLHLSALARQLRTLSSNTTLEATRMRMSGPLAEIARQMRRIAQQIGESNDQLGLALRSYTVATGELRQAATIMQGEVKVLSVQPAQDEASSVGMRLASGGPTPLTPRAAQGSDPRRRYRGRPDSIS